MRLHQDQNLKTETSHPFKTQEFSIKASPAAFQILSSGLYQDKITAVIRELSTNAFDGHVAAEKNGVVGQTKVPFDVTLPSRLNPVFKVRDYGTGLSEEEVFNLYTTYFGSTKQDSDDFIGALGLGSKSPFSLVSTFIVVSFYNGQKTVYSANIGDDGFPTIVKMHQEATTEPNGMEISITVSPADHQNFVNRAGQVYTYFKTKPNFLGSVKAYPEVVKYNYQGTKWGLRNSWRDSASAIQGQVKYNVLSSALEGRIDKDLYEFYTKVLEHLDMLFDIGEVEIQASREALSYTNRTIKAVEQVIRNCKTELIQAVRNRIEQAATYYDACAIFANLSSYENIAAKDQTFVWKGRVVAPVLKYAHKFVAQRYSRGVITIPGIPPLPDTQKINYAHYSYAPSYRIYNIDGDYIASNQHKKYIDYVPDPAAPTDKTQALSIEQEIEHRFNPVAVNGALIVHNTAGTAIFKLRNYIRDHRDKFKDYAHIYIVDKKAADWVQILKDTFGIKNHITTDDWEVSDEHSKLAKGVRSFGPRFVDYANRYRSPFYPTSCIKSIADVTKLDPQHYQYYVVTDKNAFAFKHPFDDAVTIDATELNDVIYSFVELKMLEPDVRIILCNKGVEPILNKLFPDIKPFGAILERKWSKLSPETQVAIGNVVAYNTSSTKTSHDFYSGVSPFMNFLDLISNSGKVDKNFRKWADDTLKQYKQAYGTAKAITQIGVRKNFRFVEKYITDTWGKNAPPISHGVQVKTAIEKQIEAAFPLFKAIRGRLCQNEGTTYRPSLDNTDVYLQYLGYDWNRMIAAEQKELETI